MGKALEDKQLRRQPVTRTLLAVSLAATLAAFGCTTNRTLGDGDPTTAGAGVRTPPTGGVTSGTEGASSLPPSMTSSYSRPDLNVSRDVRYVPADQVAAYMARVEATPSVRFLGPSAPGAAPPPSASAAQVTGQFVNPALVVNPQLTINSSSSSQPTPAIISGAGGTADAGAFLGGVVDADGFVAGLVESGLVVGGNVVPPGGPVFLPSSAPVTPTSAGLPIPAGAFATGPGITPGVVAGTAPLPVSDGTPTPTAVSSLNPPLTAVSGGALIGTAPVTAAAQPLRLDAARRSAVSRTVTAGATASGDVRIATGSNGRLVVTNVSSPR
jgi:hypothetical protein